MYRADIASYTRKNREKSIFYLTHYAYRYILKLHHINILNHYQTIFNHYWTSIELLPNVYRTSIESLLNIYQTTIVPLLNIYRTSIESHQTSIRALSNHYWIIYWIILHRFRQSDTIGRQRSKRNLAKTYISGKEKRVIGKNVHARDSYHYRTIFKPLSNICRIAFNAFSNHIEYFLQRRSEQACLDCITEDNML